METRFEVLESASVENVPMDVPLIADLELETMAAYEKAHTDALVQAEAAYLELVRMAA